MSRLQVFSPSQRAPTSGKAYHVPLEILVDYRCEHAGFQRLLPQTEARIHYDKFNRLRLRNESTIDFVEGATGMNDHLRTRTVRFSTRIRFIM